MFDGIMPLILPGDGISDPKGQMTLGPLAFDQKNGIGAVPDNANVVYMGFACIMLPAQFQALVPTLDLRMTNNLTGIRKAIQMHDPIGSPFLDIALNDEDADETPVVRSHEGRTRVEAIRQLHGETPILVHVFLRDQYGRGLRARHIGIEHIRTFRSRCVREKTKDLVIGPMCHETVHYDGRWQSVAETNHAASSQQTPR